jgi:hypothetical protein
VYSSVDPQILLGAEKVQTPGKNWGKTSLRIDGFKHLGPFHLKETGHRNQTTALPVFFWGWNQLVKHPGNQLMVHPGLAALQGSARWRENPHVTYPTFTYVYEIRI